MPPLALWRLAADPDDIVARKAAQRSHTMVLADLPDRSRLRDLQRALEERRDQIAALDLDMETLREALARFEATYEAQLQSEHGRLGAIRSLVVHLQRWTEVLREAPREQVVLRARHVEQNREREVRRMERELRETPEPLPPEPPQRDEQLKSIYRALARRFHPDLAATEQERVQAGERMARVNALYRVGDLSRLELMLEQAKGGEVDAPEQPLEEQLQQLEERLRWFDAVLENLRQERADLERCPTCTLLRSAEQAQALGKDPFDDIRAELKGGAERALKDVRRALVRLEEQVRNYNRRQGGELAPQPMSRSSSALERVFDPYDDKRLVRLGLEQLAAVQVRPAARQQAEALIALVDDAPAVLRLVLMTYAAELSPFPLDGLASSADVELRLLHLCRHDAPPARRDARFEEVLVDAADLVEFGIRKVSGQVARLGLRFRSGLAREAMPVVLQSEAVRGELRRVLTVLGERARCEACGEDVFAVPLFKTRGLDDLRASVCPACGHVLRSYWMPKGKDVQAVLNDAFLDLDVVCEWSFRLGRSSVALQLLPIQVATLKVGELRRRFFADVLDRYELGLSLGQVQLFQGTEKVPDKVRLDELDERGFTVRFAEDAPLAVSDAIELLRHRIRNRFRPEGTKAT